MDGKRSGNGRDWRTAGVIVGILLLLAAMLLLAVGLDRPERGISVRLSALIGLLGFGLLYNQAVDYLERERIERGVTAFLVVGGVLATLMLAAPVIGREAALDVLLCFAASGLPMVMGSWLRYAAQRREDERRAAEITRGILGDDETTGR